MRIVDLSYLFSQLNIPEQGDGNNSFFTLEIPNAPGYRIGKDSSGLPCLLIPINEQQDIGDNLIVLENVAFIPRIQCRIYHFDNFLEESLFSLMRCTSSDDVIQSYFLRVLSLIIADINSASSQNSISTSIKKMVELFRTLSLSPRKTVQGLWAEIFLIAKSKSPNLLIDAWHVEKDSIYDFGSGRQYVEVKSTSTRTRRHHFSLNQLTPPKTADVLVISLFVERIGAGTSINDMIAALQQRVDISAASILKVESVVALTLGNSWRQAVEDSFDFELASQSLLAYDVKSIPTIDCQIPSAITGVNFYSDLSQIKPIKIRKSVSSHLLFDVLPV